MAETKFTEDFLTKVLSKCVVNPTTQCLECTDKVDAFIAEARYVSTI